MPCSRCDLRRPGMPRVLTRSASQDDLSEFEESREILESLADEYKACEGADYLAWCSARE